jgi:hypothetical protein
MVFAALMAIYLYSPFAFEAIGQPNGKLNNVTDFDATDTSVIFLNASEAMQKFQGSNNPNFRALVFKKIAKRYEATRLFSTDDYNAIGQVIHLGLTDKYPKVAIEAAKTAASLKRKDIANDLISAYSDAPAAYPGYWEKVQLAVIASLGKTGGIEAETLFKKVLKNEGPTSVSSAVLQAIKSLKATAMSNDVSEFQKRMETVVADGRKRGDNPMLYSLFLSNAELAKGVIVSLTEGKGN